MQTTEINVLIIGSLHHNTLGVVRSLGEEGVAKEHLCVLLVDEDHNTENLISTSKYLLRENIFYVSAYSEIVPWLLSSPPFDEKSVIICCSDGASEVVMRARRELEGKYHTPSLAKDPSKLMVKSHQNSIAAASGLSIPLSEDFSKGEELFWDVFPCIVKPYKSVAGAGKADIRIVSSTEELKATISSLHADVFQIQQYIEKEMEYQLIGCSLNAGETIIIPGFTNIIRQPKNTNTGYLLYSPIDELTFDREAVEKFIRTIGYSGLFSVEFIRGKDGKDYFLEINMRNDGNAYCVKTAGVNLPYIWAYYNMFLRLPDVPITFEKPIFFIPDFNDLKVALHQKVGIFRWLKEFRSAESHSIYNRNDKAPFKFEFKRQIKRILNRH